MKGLFRITGLALFGLSSFAVSDSTKFYGSFYTALLADQGNYSIVDNGSRAGIKFERSEFYHNWSAGLRGEYGINSTSRPKEFQLKNNSLTSTSSSGPFSNRLGYIYFKYNDDFKISIGKQWSPFYDVTAVTDVFSIFGASASGAFSLSSDGGYLGTGRADNSVLFSQQINKIKLSALYVATGNQKIELLNENGESLPGKPTRTYKRSFGGAFQYRDDSFTFGIANMTGNFIKDKKDENSHATTVGTSYKIADLSLAGVYTISRRIEIDNNGIIFGARGLETTMTYRLSEDVSMSVGLNKLKPDDKSYKLLNDNHFLVEKYIFALTLTKDFFTAALEGVSDKSKNANASKTSDNIVGLSIGIKL